MPGTRAVHPGQRRSNGRSVGLLARQDLLPVQKHASRQGKSTWLELAGELPMSLARSAIAHAHSHCTSAPSRAAGELTERHRRPSSGGSTAVRCRMLSQLVKQVASTSDVARCAAGEVDRWRLVLVDSTSGARPISAAHGELEQVYPAQHPAVAPCSPAGWPGGSGASMRARRSFSHARLRHATPLGSCRRVLAG